MPAHCAEGTNGDQCQYEDSVTCNGHGGVNYFGFCLCDQGWDEAWSIYGRCAYCLPGFYPTNLICTDTDNSATDSMGNSCGDYDANHTLCRAGLDDDDFTASSMCCACVGGSWEQNRNGRYQQVVNDSDCRFSDATTCNNRGTVSDSGICTCDPGYRGSNCEIENEPGYTYPPTQVTTRSPSTPAPSPNPTKMPTPSGCAPGTTGPNCVYSDAVTCRGRGTARYDGFCDCIEGWSDLWTIFGRCNTCTEGFLPTAGIIGNTVTDCLHSDATTCSNHGTATIFGTCICDAGYSGADCSVYAGGVGGLNMTFDDDDGSAKEEQEETPAIQTMSALIPAVVLTLLIVMFIVIFVVRLRTRHRSSSLVVQSPDQHDDPSSIDLGAPREVWMDAKIASSTGHFYPGARTPQMNAVTSTLARSRSTCRDTHGATYESSTESSGEYLIIPAQSCDIVGPAQLELPTADGEVPALNCPVYHKL